eukprot:323376-Amphidinium_carterae.1
MVGIPSEARFRGHAIWATQISYKSKRRAAFWGANAKSRPTCDLKNLSGVVKKRLKLSGCAHEHLSQCKCVLTAYDR